MDPARIADLLVPFLAPASSGSFLEPCHSEERSDEESAVLSPAQLRHISTYIDLLLCWNARINLTAVRDPEEIVTRHFGESFFAARRLFPNPSAPSASSAGKDFDLAQTVADLGSGAGFPGLPIKLWAPGVSLTLIESNHKKAAFLREVTRALTLADVNIQAVRAETLTAASFALVTLRAVERFDTVLPVAADLLAAGGRLALLIGSGQIGQARASLPHLRWSEPEPIPESRSRVLAVACRAP